MNVEARIAKSISETLPFIRLRKLTIHDFPAYFKWFNDKDVRKMLSPNTPRDLESIFNSINRRVHDVSLDQRIVLYKDQPVGHVGIKVFEVGCMIGEKRYWGSCVGITAAFLAFGIGFNEKELDEMFITRRKTALNEKDRLEELMWEKMGFKKNVDIDGDYSYLVTKDQYNLFAQKIVK